MSGTRRATKVAAEGDARIAAAYCIRHPAERSEDGCPTCRREAQAQADALRQRERALDARGLKGRFRDATFDAFVASTPPMRDALARCRAFAESIQPDCGRNLLLLGPPGTGKTHLLSAIVLHCLDERTLTIETRHGPHEIPYLGRVITVRDLIREIRDTWAPDSMFTESEVIDEYGSEQLLALDEAGAANGTEAAQTQLLDVIDRRYQMRHPTVAASNLNLPQLEDALGERVTDRLLEGCEIVVCDWPSYRRPKR